MGIYSDTRNPAEYSKYFVSSFSRSTSRLQHGLSTLWFQHAARRRPVGSWTVRATMKQSKLIDGSYGPNMLSIAGHRLEPNTAYKVSFY